MIPALLLLAQAADPISAAIATMSPEQKAAQLQSTAPADPAIGLPAYDWWNEGLHGLARDGQATVFPQAIGLAATWDTDLLTQVGTVVSTEARAKFNAQPVTANRRIYQGLTIWSPNINIFRDPRWGRGQETYGEDPYLTGTLGVAFVQGLQGPDPAHPRVVATPKHFAVHSGPEAGRDSFDVDPSPRDLEATYFPAFRRTITEGRAMSLMCAYNSIHGVPACASSPLMNERLRRDWGFTGFTVSDCDAVGNISSYHHYRLDTALTRAFRARQALGIAFGGTSPYSRIRPDQVGTPTHQAIALEAARKSIVLLQNNADRLPLKAGAKIAVIGADADDLGVLQGNYHGTAIRPVTPLDGIRARFGAANVSYAQGSALADGAAVVVPETALRSGGKPGLRAGYSGPASVTRQDRRIDLDFNRAPVAPGLPVGPFKANWTGEFVPPGPGQYRLIIDQSQCWKDCTTHDSARVTLGGKVLHDGPLPKGRVEMTVDSDGTPQPIAITLDHVSDDESFRLLWMPPAQPLLDQAVAAVRDADVAIVVAGLSPDLEGEALSVSVPGFVGGDRTDIALPLPQQRLLAALKATGKPIVLVLSSGSAVSVDPTSADAILANWYPGEAGGTALADVLSGVTNPGGRLPVTFYRATTDLPAFIDYAMKERTYRYFTGTPLWGFGHGLSYTRFGYAAPRGAASVAAGQPLTVETTVTNTGPRDGDEVVQAYLVPPASTRPLGSTEAVLQRQLVGYRRINLKRGKGMAVAFTLTPRDMSIVDHDGRRHVAPGAYRLYVGGGQPGDGAGQWFDFAVTGTDTDLPK